MFEPSNDKTTSAKVALSADRQQADDLRIVDEKKSKSSMFTLTASDGGWRFKLPGETLVELMSEDGDGPLVSLNQCRVGQRVLHLGRVHRIVEIAADGMTRRLIHKSPERTP